MNYAKNFVWKVKDGTERLPQMLHKMAAIEPAKDDDKESGSLEKNGFE